MTLGIFSKVYKHYPLREAFSRIRQKGMKSVQFNFANVGLSSLPNEIDQEVIEEIKQSSNQTGITIAVISGTFNTLELNEEKHRQNMQGFKTAVDAAATLEVPYVSISTGSFNQEDFWSPHPENHTQRAWDHLYRSLDEMLQIASSKGIVIVIEPEQANVISTAEDILRLFDHYGNSPYLKVLFDAANIVTTEDSDQLEAKITESLKQLGASIAVAHCKDCTVTEKKIAFAPVGKGNLPLKRYLEELGKYYNGPILMHGLEEEDVDDALAYLQGGE